MSYRKASVLDLVFDETTKPHLTEDVSLSGSESPAGFDGTGGDKREGERLREMAKMLIGNGDDKQHLSNEISAPYEVPQYPIEQIETKLIR